MLHISYGSARIIALAVVLNDVRVDMHIDVYTEHANKHVSSVRHGTVGKLSSRWF